MGEMRTAEEKAAEFVKAARHQAGGGVHCWADGAARQADGPCRRHHQRRSGTAKEKIAALRPQASRSRQPGDLV